MAHGYAAEPVILPANLEINGSAGFLPGLSAVLVGFQEKLVQPKDERIGLAMMRHWKGRALVAVRFVSSPTFEKLSPLPPKTGRNGESGQRKVPYSSGLTRILDFSFTTSTKAR